MTTTYYDGLTIQQRQSYDTQEAFLHAYEAEGKLYLAAKTIETSINTVESWQHMDTHGFQKRLQNSQRVYTEKWEAIMDARLQDPQGNRGSDPLLMFKLKALDPAKYREEIKVVDQGAALKTWELLKSLATAVPKSLEAGEVVGGESGVVEAEVREVGSDESGSG